MVYDVARQPLRLYAPHLIASGVHRPQAQQGTRLTAYPDVATGRLHHAVGPIAEGRLGSANGAVGSQIAHQPVVTVENPNGSILLRGQPPPSAALVHEGTGLDLPRTVDQAGRMVGGRRLGHPVALYLPDVTLTVLQSGSLLGAAAVGPLRAVLQPIVPDVEQKRPRIGTTDDITCIVYLDSPYHFRLDVAAVARHGLHLAELVAVEPVQPVPRSKPDKALAVLHNARHPPVRQSRAVVEGHRLLSTHAQTAAEQQE